MQRVTLENETKVGLLYALKDFTTETVKDLLMPVKRQKQDEREPKRRAAAVFLARLPDMTSFEKKAPFILHQAVTGEDGLKNANKGTGRESRLELQSSAVIRSVFCVYHPDEEEGGLALLNIMEEMRNTFLKRLRPFRRRRWQRWASPLWWGPRRSSLRRSPQSPTSPCW